jgi:hypothetical protein
MTFRIDTEGTEHYEETNNINVQSKNQVDEQGGQKVEIEVDWRVGSNITNDLICSFKTYLAEYLKMENQMHENMTKNEKQSDLNQHILAKNLIEKQ